MPHYKDLNNGLHFLDDASFAHLLPEGSVEITDAEADALRLVHTPTYAEKRAAEYPSFADQFDLLYHGGLDAWKDAIQAVKTKYPKE
jgi:hypothetical protein